MAKLFTLSCKGGDLVPALAQSLNTLAEHGPAWLAEVAKARRVTGLPNAELVHPDILPLEYELWITLDG